MLSGENLLTVRKALRKAAAEKLGSQQDAGKHCGADSDGASSAPNRPGVSNTGSNNAANADAQGSRAGHGKHRLAWTGEQTPKSTRGRSTFTAVTNQATPTNTCIEVSAPTSSRVRRFGRPPMQQPGSIPRGIAAQGSRLQLPERPTAEASGPQELPAKRVRLTNQPMPEAALKETTPVSRRIEHAAAADEVRAAILTAPLCCIALILWHNCSRLPASVGKDIFKALGLKGILTYRCHLSGWWMLLNVLCLKSSMIKLSLR